MPPPTRAATAWVMSTSEEAQRRERRAALAPTTLDGVWVPVLAEISGYQLAVTELRVAQLILDRGAYAIIDTRLQVVDRGDFLVDDTQSPQAIDIVGVDGPNAGRTLLAIYEFAGSRLTVCYDLEGRSRPLTMVAQPEQHLLKLTYARAPSTLS
jgi:uncharacterized protein (TIGR03067 family)